MIVIEMKGRYIDRRAALSCRRGKVDKPSKWAACGLIVIGLGIMFTPAVLGAVFISPLGAVVWVVMGLCWLVEGVKTIKEWLKDG